MANIHFHTVTPDDSYQCECSLWLRNHDRLQQLIQLVLNQVWQLTHLALVLFNHV